MSNERQLTLHQALALPLPDGDYMLGEDGTFAPWHHVVRGIYGNYSSQCDDMMIKALEAVRDRQTFDFIDKHGFAGEFMLYVLAGNGLTEYGTSPRGAWPMYPDLWQQLIDKWKAYRAIAWGGNGE